MVATASSVICPGMIASWMDFTVVNDKPVHEATFPFEDWRGHAPFPTTPACIDQRIVLEASQYFGRFRSHRTNGRSTFEAKAGGARTI